MKLSEIPMADWQVIRDGEFLSLGLCGARPSVPILTFAGSEKYLKNAVRNPDVSCILCPPELAASDLIRTSGKGICTCENIRVGFFKFHNELAKGDISEGYLRGVFPVKIGRNAAISDDAILDSENIIIGDNAVIEPFVRIHANVQIGENSIIRSGTILGGTGLEFIRMDDGGILPVTHCGGLVIGKNVEIQYNCNVSRSLFPWDDTVIGDDTKIESLVHVAHGVKIGQRNLIAACACIGGSAELGNDIWVGPNATISSEVKVDDHSRISLGAVVAGNVARGQTVTGNFAMNHEQFMQDQLRKML